MILWCLNHQRTWKNNVFRVLMNFFSSELGIIFCIPRMKTASLKQVYQHLKTVSITAWIVKCIGKLSLPAFGNSDNYLLYGLEHLLKEKMLEYLLKEKVHLHLKAVKATAKFGKYIKKKLYLNLNTVKMTVSFGK